MIQQNTIITSFLIAFIFLFICKEDTYGQQDTVLAEIEIWPGAGPGSDTLTMTEVITERGLTGTCTIDRAITDVTVPTITPMIPANPLGSAFVICPGGAYQRVVYDVEGMDVGRWLNTCGITAFVLKYRLPADDHIDKKNVPLQDAQRAIRYIKNNAAEWDLDTSKIGIAGASAGGHVAATLATSFDKYTYAPGDSIDSLSAKPYYMFLLYPVVSMETDITHIGSRNLLLGSDPSQELIDEFSAEKHVSSNSSKTFIAVAADDGGVNPENSQRLHNALVDSGVVSKLNIYANGGHGVGICKTGSSDFGNWYKDCAKWLDSLGLGIAPEYPEPDPEPNTIEESFNTRDLFYISPNPVTQNSSIHFTLNTEKHVRISLYDLTGKQISTLVNEFKMSGDYSINLGELALKTKGVYILRFDDGQSSKAKIVVFMPD